MLRRLYCGVFMPFPVLCNVSVFTCFVSHVMPVGKKFLVCVLLHEFRVIASWTRPTLEATT